MSKRIVRAEAYNSLHNSEFQGLSYGIRNTGKNLGDNVWKLPACQYYLIADDNRLGGL